MPHDTIDELRYRRSLLDNAGVDIGPRLVAFYAWLIDTQETREIIDSVVAQNDPVEILKKVVPNRPIPASTPSQIAAVGFEFMRLCSEGSQLHDVAYQYGIGARYGGRSAMDVNEGIMTRFVEPAMDLLERRLEEQADEDRDPLVTDQIEAHFPLEITRSYQHFVRDHPDPRRAAFIMMQFGTTKAHGAIIDAIKDTLGQYGIEGLRADDKEYHEDLFPNVLTYVYGCAWGIAVFERLEEEIFNPNVSLEVGYMKALGKPICLLKDKTLKTLHTDLMGKLYRDFDPQDPDGSIPEVLERWMRDKEILS